MPMQFWHCPQMLLCYFFPIIFQYSLLCLFSCIVYQFFHDILLKNIKRFPEDFCFPLTDVEHENLKCQLDISSLGKSGYGGRDYLPYVLGAVIGNFEKMK